MSEPTFPTWLEPMAATLTRERFSSPDWVFERKLDGIRLLGFKHAGQVRLLSRNQLAQNHHYPAFVAAIEALPARDLILDGEATGVWMEQHEPRYHVFDLPWLEGRDLTALPLDRRREALQALPLESPLVLVPRLTEESPWERACQEGWEGVVAKRRDSAYEQRRSPLWLKMKCEASQELVVGGFTDPQGSRRGLGALLVGYFDAGELVFAGKVGTGFDTRRLLELRARLDTRQVTEAPFVRGSGLPRVGVHWVAPELVVQVAFMEWTKHGKLRHPRLLGLREDKNARDVTREPA
jgi:bifunctional non-homologous end joining protein LigD